MQGTLSMMANTSADSGNTLYREYLTSAWAVLVAALVVACSNAPPTQQADALPDGTIKSPAEGATLVVSAPVNFEGVCSDPAEAPPLYHVWDFGGAAPESRAQSPRNVVFTSPGAHTVTYTCGNGAGDEDPTPASISVTVEPAPTELTARILNPAQAPSIAAGESVYFSGLCAGPSGAEITSHSWDFDGGADASSEADPGEVRFETPGEYQVSYTCTDAAGETSDPATLEVTVSAGSVLMYKADTNTPEVFELFHVNLANPGTAAKLNVPLTAPGGGVEHVYPRSDGSGVAYLGYMENESDEKLYWVERDDPGSAVELTDGSGRVRDVTFSPDGSWLLYVLIDAHWTRILYGVDLTADPLEPVRLSQAAPEGSDDEVGFYKTTADSERVVYLYGSRRNYSLFTVTLSATPGAPQILHAPSTRRNRGVSDEQPFVLLSPDGTKAAYLARHDNLDSDRDYERSLYVADLTDVGTAYRVSGDLAGGQGWAYPGYHFSADSQRLFYVASEETKTDGTPVRGLYMTDVSNFTSIPAPERLSAAPDAMFGRVQWRSVQLCDNDAGIVYVAEEQEGIYELFFVDLSGESPQPRVSVSAGSEADRRSVALASDCSKIAFAAEDTVAGSSDSAGFQPYLARVADLGDTDYSPTPIHGALQMGEGIVSYRGQPMRFTPNGAYILYRLTDADDTTRLFGAPADPLGAPQQLTDALGAEDEVGRYGVTPDEQALVFELTVESVPEGAGDSIQYVDISSWPPAAPQPISPAPLEGVSPEVRDFELTDDGRYVVYQWDGSGAGAAYVTSVEAPHTITELSAQPQAVAADVGSFAVSPNKQWVAYTADPDVDRVDKVFLLPADAPDEAITLFTETGEASVSADGFRFTSDSSHFIFAATGSDDKERLFVTSLDAPTAASERALTDVGGHLYEDELTLSPDEKRVYFRATLSGDAPPEIYALALSGSGPPTKLSGPLVEGGQVHDFVLSPSGERLLYRADASTDEVDELYAVEVTDLSNASSQKVNPDFGDVGERGVQESYGFTPDESGILYVADPVPDPEGAPQADGRYELFHVPADDLGNATSISGSPSDSGLSHRDGAFSIAPDGSAVAYVAQQDSTTRELYVASLSPPGSPTKLNATVVDGGGVARLEWSPDSQAIVYLGDLETEYLRELFWVAADGQSAPVKLNAPLDSNVDQFGFSPSGRHFFYLAQHADADVEHVYLLDMVGAQTPVRASGIVQPSGEVRSAEFFEHGQKIMYYADVNGDDQLQYYVVDVTLPTIAPRANGALPEGSRIAGATIF